MSELQFFSVAMQKLKRKKECYYVENSYNIYKDDLVLFCFFAQQVYIFLLDLARLFLLFLFKCPTYNDLGFLFVWFQQIDSHLCQLSCIHLKIY